MTAEARAPLGVPPINFLIHQARCGEAGATQEFEQMLALLVQATDAGAAHLIFPVRGDWGIDVLVGELNGAVTIWQAKFFANGVRRHQLDAIRSSFESACRAAHANGYRIQRWVLCIPCSMEASALQRWQVWRATEQARTGIVMELWDETTLRDLLMRPAAAHVRQAFYHPYREAEPPSTGQYLRIRPAGANLGTTAPGGAEPGGTEPGGWRGGAEVELGGVRYLLHEPVESQEGPDRTWVWWEATVELAEPATTHSDHPRVRLRRLELPRPTPAGRERRDGLCVQADLLSAIGGRDGLPDLVGRYADGESFILATTVPAAPTWRAAFGPEPAAVPGRLAMPDRLAAAAALAAVVPVGAALSRLHRRGFAHRALSPDAIVVVDRLRRGVLRDIGLVGMRPAPEEGPAAYRAPEQRRLATGPGRVGPHTDVYQLAAVLYHTLTGHPATPVVNPPVRASLPGFPAELDDLLTRALDANPARRPAMPDLAAGLRHGRGVLSRGDRA